MFTLSYLVVYFSGFGAARVITTADTATMARIMIMFLAILSVCRTLWCALVGGRPRENGWGGRKACIVTGAETPRRYIGSRPRRPYGRTDGRTDGPAATERARIAVTSRGRDTHYGAGRTASNRFRNFPTRSARRAPSLPLDIRVKRFVFFSPVKNSGHNFASENADRPGSRTNESKRQIVCVTWIFFYIRILYWPTTMRILTFEFFYGEHSIGGSEFQFHLV